MSQHSALASLTAQYTDSEEEAELEAEANEAEGSSVQILTNFSSRVSSSGESPAGSVTGTPKLEEAQPEENGEEEPTAAPSEELEDEEEKPSEVKRRRTLLPPEVAGKCDEKLQEKFTKMLEKKIKGGLDMNYAIQRNKNFRNPSIYEKLIKYCDIDEFGSNYPPTIFDPHEFHESSFYDELAKAQKELMERREKERKERTKVDFVSGTVKKTSTPSMESAEAKRKSKWDQRGVMPPLLLGTSLSVQPPVVIPPFTSAVSGTKSTVISAFGNISKKNMSSGSEKSTPANKILTLL